MVQTRSTGREAPLPSRVHLPTAKSRDSANWSEPPPTKSSTVNWSRVPPSSCPPPKTMVNWSGSPLHPKTGQLVKVNWSATFPAPQDRGQLVGAPLTKSSTVNWSAPSDPKAVINWSEDPPLATPPHHKSHDTVNWSRVPPSCEQSPRPWSTGRSPPTPKHWSTGRDPSHQNF